MDNSSALLCFALAWMSLSALFRALFVRGAEEAKPTDGVPPLRALSLRLLVVDDDRCFSGALKRALERLGHEVHLAGTPEEATEKLRERRFDCVLCDYFLDSATGDEVGHGLGTSHRDRFVLMSGAERAELRGSARNFPFLKKPFTAGKCVELAARVCGENITAS